MQLLFYFNFLFFFAYGLWIARKYFFIMKLINNQQTILALRMFMLVILDIMVDLCLNLQPIIPQVNIKRLYRGLQKKLDSLNIRLKNLTHYKLLFFTLLMSESQTQMQSGQVINNQNEDACYMFNWVQDQDGNYLPMMLPDYVDLFNNLFGLINRLRQTKDKKWTVEQEKAYDQYLFDLENYVRTYVFTASIQDYNVFEQAIGSYAQSVNPLGSQLYNRQIDYIQKKDEGYDFNKEKKEQKKLERLEKGIPEDRPRREREEKPKQEVQIIRKDDPDITTEELVKKKFPEDRYTNLEQFRLENANLIFIGHVDSGKSTLTGNIMKELKQVDEQELTRNKQEAKENNMQAWELAFIADVDPNQRKRGKTVQCSKMMFCLQSRRYTLFDAPGHKNYVPNMMMGACQADIAVLIISAKQGQFESGFKKDGQTKQHAMLATALGVQKMIAVVTKMATVQWSEERYKEIKDQVQPFLKSSCGFKDVEFIPIDSLTNKNIHFPSQEPEGKWYKGPTLIEILNKVPLPQRNPDGPLRIPIVDKFKDVGQFFLYGKVESGKIALEGQTVTLLPNRQYFTIKQIFNAKDERLPYALAGENVKLRVKGIQEDQIHRGDIICNNLNYCQQSQEFKANLTVLELPEHKKLVSSGYQCIIHMHAISEQAQISLVQGKYNDQTKKTSKATFLRTGETGKVVIKIHNPICLEKFDFMPQLGKFTLRDEGKTIGYGEVTKIKPAKKLTKEQHDQLGVKTQMEAATTEIEKAVETKE